MADDADRADGEIKLSGGRASIAMAVLPLRNDFDLSWCTIHADQR